jgi:hypothetical protein
MKHVPFSPNLYTIFDTFYEMIYVTFESEGNANWPFLLQVDFLGDGSTKTNIKMKTKWLFNTSRSQFSPNLYTTASHVLCNDLRKLRE